MIEVAQPRWQSCVVAAPGPSLPLAVDDVCASGLPTIVVQDSWRKMPWADVLYGCDNSWWEYYKGTEFRGEKWSSHESLEREQHVNDKLEAQEKYGLRLIAGKDGAGFSLDPRWIHYGSNSGFQAINLAILFGCTHIILVGYDMGHVGGEAHFFGEHPVPIRAAPDYGRFVRFFDDGAKRLPDTIRIVNSTPGSALKCFPAMSLEDALADSLLHWHRAIAHA